jgi:hypothetical protein
MSPDPFVDQTRLALLSLRYNERWCKRFKTVYQEAMDSRTLLKGQGKVSTVDDQENCYENKIDNVWLTVNKYAEGLKLKESIMSHEKTLLKTGMYTNYYKDLCKQTEMKQNTKDKCDPLHLATVYQTLRDEVKFIVK